MPIQLIVNADGTSVDLVMPCTYSMPFWIALQYARYILDSNIVTLMLRARCVAQRHVVHMALETQRTAWPYHAVDTAVGRIEQNAMVCYLGWVLYGLL